MVASAQAHASPTWAQSFVYGQGIDQIVMIEQADVLDYDNDTDTGEVVRNFYHRNALGSVMFISEPDETEAATYRYTPYGEQSISRGGTPQGTDPLGQSIGFTGRWRDAESGLWHYRARAYSSAMGRFLQRDPLGYGPGPNVYEYCWSAPVTWLDPTGTEPRGGGQGGGGWRPGHAWQPEGPPLPPLTVPTREADGSSLGWEKNPDFGGYSMDGG